MVKTVYVTHNDLDGISASLLIEYFDLERDFLVALDYGFEENHEIVERIETYDKIVMVDITCSEIYYNRLTSMGKEVWIYDHHDNDSNQWCRTTKNCFLVEGICGTKVFLDYYIRKKKRIKPIVTQYVDIVSTYDLYQTESKLWDQALGLSYVFYGGRDNDKKGKEIYREFINDQKKKFDSDTEWGFNMFESSIVCKGKIAENRVYAEAEGQIEYRLDSRGKTFGLICLSSKVSITAYSLLKNKPFMDYVVIVNTYKGINGRISCRSRKNGFNCTELSVFNGHAEASGGELEPELLKEFIKDSALTISYGEAGVVDPFVEVR